MRNIFDKINTVVIIQQHKSKSKSKNNYANAYKLAW